VPKLMFLLFVHGEFVSSDFDGFIFLNECLKKIHFRNMQVLCNYYHFDIKGGFFWQNDHLHGLLILYLKGTRISIFHLFGRHMDFFFLN
jgi:hypothetical protein